MKEKPVKIHLKVTSGDSFITVTATSPLMYIAGCDRLSRIMTTYHADERRIGKHAARQLAISGTKKQFTFYWDQNEKNGKFDKTPFKFIMTK